MPLAKLTMGSSGKSPTAGASHLQSTIRRTLSTFFLAENSQFRSQSAVAATILRDLEVSCSSFDVLFQVSHVVALSRSE